MAQRPARRQTRLESPLNAKLSDSHICCEKMQQFPNRYPAAQKCNTTPVEKRKSFCVWLKKRVCR